MAIIGVGCNERPANAISSSEIPTIFPDYTDVTIPCNIAPLNFRPNVESVESCYAEVSCNGQSMEVYGKTDIRFNEKEWRKMLANGKESDITITLYTKQQGKWAEWKAFNIHVSDKPIDSHLVYRLIEPGYEKWHIVGVYQRNLTNFDENMIYNNMLQSNDVDGQCINCHSYKNYKTDNMQFHVRQHKGGTMLVTNGEVKKINLKTDSTISAGVYPAWHPTHNLIAYSINDTGQSFHTKNNNKIEVQDLKSDLILYDIDRNEVSFIEHDTLEWEVFPAWAPDGRTLYYNSAHYEIQNFAGKEREIIDNYKNFHYNIYRKSFDPETKTFGPAEMVLNADSLGKSATLPRISPDGRYLLFGMAEYGCFHIWHKDADLYMIDLQTMALRNMRELNSNDVESYHSWSSNGRWILYTSRRDDGGYTRLYIAYFDKQGRAHKPFILPQEDPYFYNDYYKSYNVPEYMIEPVTITPQEFARYIDTEVVPAKFKSQNL